MTPYEKNRTLVKKRAGMLSNRHGGPLPRSIEEELAEDIDRVIDVVSSVTDIPRRQIVGKKGIRPVFDARHMVFYVAMKRGHRLEQVGDMVGDRHYATVAHGRDKIEGLMEIEKEIAETVNEILERL